MLRSDFGAAFLILAALFCAPILAGGPTFLRTPAIAGFV